MPRILQFKDAFDMESLSRELPQEMREKLRPSTAKLRQHYSFFKQVVGVVGWLEA